MSDSYGLRSMTINGTPYAVNGDCSIEAGGVIYEAVANSDASYSEVGHYEVPTITVTIRKPKSLDLQSLTGARGLSVRIVTLSGEVFSMTNCMQSLKPKYDTKTGDLQLAFSGGKLL